MSDLISRKGLNDALIDLFQEIDDMYIAGRVISLVNLQPTAYDIDKVVEQLEDLKKHEADGSCPKIGMCIKGAESCATCCTDTAIEIVKGGAVDDETMA